MKLKLILMSIILFTLSIFVLSSVMADAPPPIPTEYWGRLVIDGQPAPEGTEVKYWDGAEWIITTTTDGWYNIILTGGDSPLTYNDDPDCSTHWANEQACIPCTQDVDCVEGPQEGDSVNIIVNDVPVSVTWRLEASGEENVIVSIPLYTGWNMISLPVSVSPNSPQDVLSLLTGRKVAYYYDASEPDPLQRWRSYDSTTPEFTWDLNILEPNKGYWVKVDSDQTLSITGVVPDSNEFQLYTGWNMVGFQLYSDTIQNAMDRLTGHRVAYYYDASEPDPLQRWRSYDSTTPEFTWDLEEVEIGYGYWVKVDSDQIWGE